ncbi:MAG: hypothetical protein Q7T18_12920 [Sedimentisphaerales bacterium]|nr:hypothetical protein [Sedimentisphaerales bacterium]
MISRNPNSICCQIEPYYFDILHGHANEPVPAEVSAHISMCDHCQAEIRHLSDVLGADGPDVRLRGVADSAVATSLALHFAYIGRSVTCDHVKPFLPSMADPALEIRVPTPITVHLDNCPQCADDLKTIHRLHLTHKQLCRLGQLFADRSVADLLLCAEVKKAMPFMAQLDFAGLPADLLRHICLCADCRRLFYKERALRSALQQDRRPAPAACNNSCAADLFDHVIPYGSEPRNDEYAKFHASFISHITACPACFGKMQDLHDTLFGILERPISNTITKFKVCGSATKDKQASSCYADWPVSVHVTHQPAVWGTVKKRIAAVNVRKFIRPAAAAAVIIGAMLFYFNTSIAHATDLAQIYKAVANIANIHIASFVPDKTEPTQQQWVSKTFTIRIFKTPTELVVWDIPNAGKRVKAIAGGNVEIVSLSRDAAADIKKNIEGSFGLLPFDEISTLPKDAQWQEVSGAETTSAGTTMVHDLTWTQKDSSGSSVEKKWRVFTDTTTNLPQRTEWYEKPAGEKDYILESYMVVDYLTESQMQGIIKDAAF